MLFQMSAYSPADSMFYNFPVYSTTIEGPPIYSETFELSPAGPFAEVSIKVWLEYETIFLFSVFGLINNLQKIVKDLTPLFPLLCETT